MRGPAAGAGCAGAERRAGIGRVLRAGMLESRDFAGLGCCGAGSDRLFGIELPRPGRAQPRGTGGALHRPIAPADKSLFGFVFVFLKQLYQPESRRGGRGNHCSAQPAPTWGCARPVPAGLGPGPRYSPAEPPNPASPLSCPLSLLLRFFAGVLLVLTLSPALPGPPAHPARADPELLLSLRFAGPPARGRGTGAVPVPKSQQH